LQIYHDGSNNHTYIEETGSGSLRIRGENLLLEDSSGKDYLNAVADAQVELFYNGSKKFETTSTGVDITGEITTDGIALGDSQKATFGASDDLQIYHDASHSWIKDTGTGNLKISAGNFEVVGAADTNAAFLYGIEGGSLYLYHNGTQKLQTTASGITVSSKLDLEVAGNDSIIRNDEGPLFVQSDSFVKFTDVGNNETFAVFNDNGSVDLYYDNIARLSTNSSGITVTGDATATNFNTTSDATLKTNVETLTGSLDAVKAMRGVSFDWLENGGSEIGVIAQEVEAVLPDVVSTNDEGIKSVKYSNMVAVLIEAIKEQQVQIDELKAQLNS